MEESHHNQDARPTYEPLPEAKMPFFFRLLDTPVTLFREKIVDPLQARNRTIYYHREYPRVPTIDKCSINDDVCLYEANEQFLRDRAVDKRISLLIGEKYKDCVFREGPFDRVEKCKKLEEMYDEALVNYFIKYGDLSAHANVLEAYMKQKHRLIWERRNPDKDVVGLEKKKKLQAEFDVENKKYFDKRL